MIRIFCDFDGTVTLRDVGDAMFEHFGGAVCTQLIEAYRREELTALECFRKECEASGTFSSRELDEFLDAQEIDQSFRAFVTFCAERGLSLSILSDGMDYYIARILMREGVTPSVFTNHLDLVPAGTDGSVRMVPSFPFTDEVCTRCAFCKRNKMLTSSADEDILVYVGEGYSDRCPARYADVVFAKSELAEHCHQEHIPFYEYRTFDDVAERMRMLLERRGKRAPLRKRRQAQLAAKAVYAGG